MVDVMLLAADVAGEATHPVVHDDDIGLEAVDQVVQRLQGRDAAAGGHIDIRAERADATVGVAFRIGVDGDVALVEVRNHGIRQGTRLLHVADQRRRIVALGDQHGDAGALRFIVLPGHVEDLGTDDGVHVGQYLGQPLGVVHLVDVLDVAALLQLGLGVADVVDVEAQRLGQVVETVQLEFVDVHRINDTPS